MKFRLIVIISILAIILTSVSITALKSLNPVGASAEKKFRYTPNEAFGFGEKLEYKVGYKFITAGTGYFYIQPKPIFYKGRECYDVRFEVRSLEALEFIYKVRDGYRTILDVAGIFPWEFQQTVREGHYKKDFKAEFDHVKELAFANDTSYKIPQYVHDIVSAFFYVRTLNLGSMRKDSVFYLKNFFEDTTYNLGVRIVGRQTIDVDAGKFRCIVIQPLVVEGGLFKSEGSIYIWLTDDDRKIPVKVATKILIGYVEAWLVRYSGTRGEVNAKLN